MIFTKTFRVIALKYSNFLAPNLLGKVIISDVSHSCGILPERYLLLNPFVNHLPLSSTKCFENSVFILSGSGDQDIWISGLVLSFTSGGSGLVSCSMYFFPD